MENNAVKIYNDLVVIQHVHKRMKDDNLIIVLIKDYSKIKEDIDNSINLINKIVDKILKS